MLVTRYLLINARPQTAERHQFVRTDRTSVERLLGRAISSLCNWMHRVVASIDFNEKQFGHQWRRLPSDLYASCCCCCCCCTLITIIILPCRCVIICPMRQQHWTDYKISLCVCQGVSESFREFWDRLHISGTVKARNFKFGTQIGHWSS